MHPVFIRLPFLPEAFQEIYSYGLMMVLGFLAGYFMAYRLAKRCGQNPGELTNLAVASLLSGVAGARAMYVIHFWHRDFSGEPIWKALNVRDGGLEFYGGVILAITIVLIYFLVRKLPIKLYFDILAPALMLGLAFGRMGCLLNGCCYGKVCDVPWAITFPYGSGAYLDHLGQGELTIPPELSNGAGGIIYPDELTAEQKVIAAKHRSLPVHPAQVYGIITALALSAFLRWYFWKRRHEGQGFLLMILLYGVARFVLELFRTEPKIRETGLSISQLVSVIMISGAVICWLWMIRRPGGQVDRKTGRIM